MSESTVVLPGRHSMEFLFCFSLDTHPWFCILSDLMDLPSTNDATYILSNLKSAPGKETAWEISHELSSCFFFFFFLYDMAVLHTKSVLGNQFPHLGPIIAFLVLTDEMGLNVGLQLQVKICFGSVGSEFCQVGIVMDHTRKQVRKLSLQNSSTSQVCRGAGLWVKRTWGSFWTVSFLCKMLKLPQLRGLGSFFQGKL